MVRTRDSYKKQPKLPKYKLSIMVVIINRHNVHKKPSCKDKFLFFVQKFLKYTVFNFQGSYKI